MIYLSRMAAYAAVISVSVDGTAAQVSAPQAGEAAVAGVVRLPALTPVEFEFAGALNSKTSKIDDMFPIRLTAPIVIDGVIAVPAGATGEGQVVHAAKAAGAGKAGELIVTVRYLEHRGVRIPLRRFRMGGLGIGTDRRDGALGVSMVIPFSGFLMRGGEKTIEAGARANAVIASDVDIPTPAEAVPAAQPPSSEASTGGE